MYQMTKLPKSEWEDYLTWLFDFEYRKLGLPKPAATIFLDMPIEISQKLLTARYGGNEQKKDLHERNIPFLTACRDAALYVGKRCGWEMIRCDGNDGNPRPAGEIQNELIRKLESGNPWISETV